MNSSDYINQTIAGYDKIAKDWHGTRRQSWGEVDEIIKKYLCEFASQIHTGISLLDVGCGNGRLINLIEEFSGQANTKINYVGIDPSHELIKICEKEYNEINKENTNIINKQFIINDGLHIKKFLLKETLDKLETTSKFDLITRKIPMRIYC